MQLKYSSGRYSLAWLTTKRLVYCIYQNLPHTEFMFYKTFDKSSCLSRARRVKYGPWYQCCIRHVLSFCLVSFVILTSLCAINHNNPGEVLILGKCYYPPFPNHIKCFFGVIMLLQCKHHFKNHATSQHVKYLHSMIFLLLFPNIYECPYSLHCQENLSNISRWCTWKVSTALFTPVINVWKGMKFLSQFLDTID